MIGLNSCQAKSGQLDDRAMVQQEESLRLGLFAYPVLQAADILLYG